MRTIHLEKATTKKRTTRYHVIVINDGTLNILRGATVSSVLDIIMITTIFSTSATSPVDLETRGRDHLPP